MIVETHNIIELSKHAIRKIPETVLKNQETGEIAYTPPSGQKEIVTYLNNLDKYIHNNDDVDHLIKLAMIHYRFEFIPPFYDGNGRVGRMLSVLYLILKYYRIAL